MVIIITVLVGGLTTLLGGICIGVAICRIVASPVLQAGVITFIGMIGWAITGYAVRRINMTKGGKAFTTDT